MRGGPYQTSVRIRTQLNWPAAFDFAAMRRSEALVELALDTYVTLRAGGVRVTESPVAYV